MICPKCSSSDSSCRDTRQRGDVRWRRYQCRNCRTYYETIERVITNQTQYIDNFISKTQK